MAWRHPSALLLQTRFLLEHEGFVERAAELGRHFVKRLRTWQLRFSWIGDVRCLGAMQAIEIVDPIDGHADATRPWLIQREALERGPLVLTAGMRGNVLQLLMPLTITHELLEEGIVILDQALVVSA